MFLVPFLSLFENTRSIHEPGTAPSTKSNYSGFLTGLPSLHISKKALHRSHPGYGALLHTVSQADQHMKQQKKITHPSLGLMSTVSCTCVAVVGGCEPHRQPLAPCEKPSLPFLHLSPEPEVCLSSCHLQL